MRSVRASGVPGSPPLGTGRPAVRGLRQGKATAEKFASHGPSSAGGLPAGATVTWVLVGLNVAVLPGRMGVTSKIVLDTSTMVAGAYDQSTIHSGRLEGVAHGQAYRLITSRVPAHEPRPDRVGPAQNIIFNMWALIIVGPALERP